jgi:hypothetical protein
MIFQPINFVPWDGSARECATLFELRKGTRRAICKLWNHPIGGELRCEVDGELLRSQAGHWTAWRCSMKRCAGRINLSERLDGA